MNFSTISIVSLISVAFATSTVACDLCGCYLPPFEQAVARWTPASPTTVTTPTGSARVSGGQQHAAPAPTSAERTLQTPILGTETVLERKRGFYGAVAEQFTHFGTLQLDGDKVGNPTGQYLNSSITQLVAGYTFTERFSLQVNIPLIYRAFKRPEGFDIQYGTVSGLGDISLLGNFVVFKKHALYHETQSGLNRDVKGSTSASQPDFSVVVNAIAGVKFPTGSPSRLKEEFNEVEVEGAPESGIHGHDLTLGTGSYDGILGLNFYLRYKRWYFDADLRYTVRGSGAYDYNFANDFTFDTGPGYYFYFTERGRVGLQFLISGEYKGKDTFQGATAEDTAITSVYLGPRFTASFGNRFAGEIGVDIPVVLNNSSLQAVADYRIRAGFAVQF